ncbi:MAG: hypothetical protein ACXWV1_01610 [Chitinophagaceae bacterium]
MILLRKKMRDILFSYTFILCFIIGSFHSASSQTIEANIEKYANQYSPERVYIHYDKAGYTAGETIWFKAYMMNEVVPAHESKTLYIDWIDDKGNLLLHAVSPLVDASTSGQFELPPDYKGKSLHVRAYTKWMLNFDSAFLYNKEIPVLTNARSAADSKNKIIPSIRFFPEGGDLVSGISNKIAFKANDQWGRPVKAKGIIINSQGKTEDKITTIHDGMGYFFLTPKSGLTYTARWKDEKDVEHNTALPKIKADGAALQIEISGNNRLFSVTCSPGLISAMDTVHLVGTVYQHLAFKISRATALPIKGTIPVTDLPSGILTITLFDKNWRPLAERITYINNNEYSFQPEMEVQRWGLNKRARNEIKITVPDSLVANLSVSVTDAAIGTDSSNHIISHLMLTSELKGKVFNPAYYFSNTSDSVSRQLDLVMLTNGWRRFKWDEIVSGKISPPPYAKDSTYISLSGKVLGVLPGQINRDAGVVLMVKQKDKEGQMLLVPIQSNGTFNDPSAIIFDTAQVYYSFQKANELKDASIQFMTGRLPAPSYNPSAFYKPYGLVPDTTSHYRQFMLADEANSVAEMSKMKTLENVTVKSKGKSTVQILDEKYSSGLFSGGDGYQFDLINDPFAASAINIFTYLQGKVAGLQINSGGAQPSMQWRGGSPQLYLDQTPVDISFISSLSVNDVAYIKVFRPPFMGGFNGANGAIAIYTRRGNDTKPEPGKGLNSNKVFGYTMIKEFYSPNYATFNTRNEQRDVRTTLFWNPSVITTPQKNQLTLSFYNNDVSGAFRIIIEGMTSDGKLAHLEQIME